MDADLTRAKAQKKAEELFGPAAFARRHTKSVPGARFQVGLRKRVPPFKVVVVGLGRSWTEAFSDAQKRFDTVTTYRDIEDQAIAVLEAADAEYQEKRLKSAKEVAAAFEKFRTPAGESATVATT